MRELTLGKDEVALFLNSLCDYTHKQNIHWWQDPVTGAPLEVNKGEKIALMHSELSEALEGERKQSMDEHLPQFKSAEVEFADAIIRIIDYCGAHGYDLGGAFVAKMAYNAVREDHTAAARLAPGGKKF